MTEAKTEKEITLAICSETPELIAEQICQLTEIGGFPLRFAGNLFMKDLYFDTHDRALKSRGWALRLREINGAHLIALKGPSRITESGIVERFELEDAWSPETFLQILEEIRSEGYNFDIHEESREFSDPIRKIEAAGFRLIQARETLRRLIDVFTFPQNSRMAELAVDTVNYRFNTTTIKHYEVELESKSEFGAEVVETIARKLQSFFKTELRLWPHSKLAIGWALESLLEDESFRIATKNLNDLGYEKIDAMLKDRP